MFTQREIAKAAGVHESLVCLILKGKRMPTWTVAKRLAAATGTDPVWWADGIIEKIKPVFKHKRRKTKEAEVIN